jgi:hypothetical protein
LAFYPVFFPTARRFRTGQAVFTVKKVAANYVPCRRMRCAADRRHDGTRVPSL